MGHKFVEWWFGIGLIMNILNIVRWNLGKQGTEPDALFTFSLFLLGPIFLLGFALRQLRIKFPRK